MKPKPAHLGPEYAAQFEDKSVALAYFTRPSYPDEFFDVLMSLMPEGSRTVLDLGCGTGDVAIGMRGRAEHIDAVDVSAAMLAIAQSRPGGTHPCLNWVCASAEAFEFKGPYSLVVAAESLHWMDWGVVVPKIAAALRPRGLLAIATGRALANVPWMDELADLISSYSTNQDFQPYDLVHELSERDLFREVGRCRTRSVPFCQPVCDYLESFHTRNGFSRERMIPGMALEFDNAVRSLVLPHCQDGIVRAETFATIVWGVPQKSNTSLNA